MSPGYVDVEHVAPGFICGPPRLRVNTTAGVYASLVLTLYSPSSMPRLVTAGGHTYVRVKHSQTVDYLLLYLRVEDLQREIQNKLSALVSSCFFGPRGSFAFMTLLSHHK